MKTAVECLVHELGLDLTTEHQDEIDFFLEMEKEQIIAFAKKCIHKALELDILMAYNQVEKYYNETFKQQEQ
jgi:hypothetical protein